MIDDVPRKRWAGICANKDFINIDTRSGYSSTVSDADQKSVYLPIDASHQELGKHLREAISLSRFVDPVKDKKLDLYLYDPARYHEWIDYVMKKFSYKTKQRMFKAMLFISITLYKGLISLEPRHQYQSEGWDMGNLTKEDNVIIPQSCTDEELGEAARLALSRCTSRWGNPLYPQD